MRFTVVWKPSAEQRLAELWAEADDQATLTSAADRIDRWLAVNPETLGESRSGHARMLIERPLAVEYEVVADDRMVVVLKVHKLPRR